MRTHPLDALAHNSGIAEKSPSKMARSTSPWQMRVAAPASSPSPVTARGHPVLEHSRIRLSTANRELFNGAGQPRTSQRRRSAILSNAEAMRSRTLHPNPGTSGIFRVMPAAISCWTQGIERVDRWTMPQISVPGTSLRILFAKFQVREGRTLDTINMRKVFMTGKRLVVDTKCYAAKAMRV